MKKHLPIFLFISISILFFSCSETKKEEVAKKENKVFKEPVGSIEACSIIGKSDMEKILNIKMKEPKEGRSQDGGKDKISFSECSFESDTVGLKIYLSIYIRFSPFKDDAYTTLQNVRSSFKQSGIEVYNVEGIGDVAFWGGSQLHVFIGENYYLIITLLGLKDHDSAITKSKIIAQKIAEDIK
jgi:hypothetical protein